WVSIWEASGGDFSDLGSWPHHRAIRAEPVRTAVRGDSFTRRQRSHREFFHLTIFIRIDRLCRSFADRRLLAFYVYPLRRYGSGPEPPPGYWDTNRGEKRSW